MHIPDGILDPSIIAIMWIVTIPFLLWSWKKTEATYSRSLIAPLAICSAFIFVVQMINFPIAGGTTGHLLGGTLISVILGPYAAILSLTIVLIMQALFFADGGLLAFGANVFNMAVIGGLSFFLVKLLTRKSKSFGRFASSIFIASFLSSILTALATGLEVGFSQTFSNVGGIILTVPSMVSVYAVLGVIEGAVTTALASSLQRFQATAMVGLEVLKGKVKI
jgi:cobalt/nickel transport system permease protein